MNPPEERGSSSRRPLHQSAVATARAWRGREKEAVGEEKHKNKGTQLNLLVYRWQPLESNRKNKGGELVKGKSKLTFTHRLDLIEAAAGIACGGDVDKSEWWVFSGGLSFVSLLGQIIPPQIMQNKRKKKWKKKKGGNLIISKRAGANS